MAVLRVPGRHQGAERRRHEPGPGVHLPGHLLRAGSEGRPSHRGAGPGDLRRLCVKAAHGPAPAHPRVQRAVRRRPHVDHRERGRHGRGRPAPGDQVLLPDAANPVQPGAGSRAESHRAVERPSAGELEAVHRQGLLRHRRPPVRKRRRDAPCLRGRLRHCLLRVRHARGQRHAVFRRPGQPGQAGAAGHQRRPGRAEGRPGRPQNARVEP